jgi:iron complex outermembrane recepter protein
MTAKSLKRIALATTCSQASFLGKGSVLPFAPKNRVTVSATYKLPIDRSIGLISVGATFTHTDEQFTGHADDAAFAAGAIPYNASINPATDLLNLNLNWNSVAQLPVDLSVFVTNATNQKYYVSGGASLAQAGGEFLILGEPRMFGVRVKVRFGT